jgi:hypothetical protein
MVENKIPKEPIPATFETFEEMADFWDTLDVTDYEEYLTPVEVNVSTHPKHKYVITLSDSLDTALRQVQQKEGVSLKGAAINRAMLQSVYKLPKLPKANYKTMNV